MRGVRRRGLAGKLALAAVSLAFSLFACEAGVRLLARDSPSLLVADPLVGKRFLPGFEGRVFVPECGCDVPLRFNRDGLRGPDRPHERPPGVRRVALVGDSMVAAVATAEERTLASLLERRLRVPQSAWSWEVMNAGVSSSSTGSKLRLYREVLAAYAPDLVVVVFWVGNDLADNSAELTSAPRLYFDVDAQDRLRQLPFAFEPHPLGEWLDRNSRFTSGRRARCGRRARRCAPQPGARAGRARLRAARARRGRARVGDHARAAASLRAGGKGARQRAGAGRGARPGAGLRRPLGRARAAGRGRGHAARPRAPRRAAARAQPSGRIPFLPLAETFRARAPHRDSRRADEQLYYDGRFHWNDAGNALAAEAIHAFLGPAREPGARERVLAGRGLAVQSGAWHPSRYPLLLLALLLPACQSAPKAPPATTAPLPELLRPYPGALRILRQKGDEKAVTLKAGEKPTGSCDLAVRVRSVAFDRGRPASRSKRWACRASASGVRAAKGCSPACSSRSRASPTRV